VNRPPASWWLLAALAAAVAVYALGHLVLGDRIFVDVLADSFRARPWGIYPHAFFGMLAIVIGAVQFLPLLPVRRRTLHRNLGKIYVATALMTGVTGLYMAGYAHGGLVATAGFGGMSIAILGTTWRAWTTARGGRIAEHRRWMIRSYAVLFSAVTLRIWLPVLVLAYEGAFTPAYLWVAWLSWVPNLAWAEWYVRRWPRLPAQTAAALSISRHPETSHA
jgi:uncharacterized membrane protein